VPDALSRLDALEYADVSKDDELENIWNYSEVVIDPELREKIRSGYRHDPHFVRILRMMGIDHPDPILEKVEQVESVNFEIENGLLFHIPLSGAPKLAILKSCVQDIFIEAHDRNHHFGFDRTFKELDGFCIPGLTK